MRGATSERLARRGERAGVAGHDIGSRRTRAAVSNVGSIRSSVRNGSVGPEPRAHTDGPAAARLCAGAPSVIEAATRREAGEIRSTERGSGNATQTEPAP